MREFPGRMSHSCGAQLCQSDLSVPTRADDVCVSGEWQELGLEDIRFVAGGEGQLFPTILPVPDDDVQIIRTGSQEVAWKRHGKDHCVTVWILRIFKVVRYGSTSFVEIEGVDAAVVPLQFVSQLKPIDERHGPHSIVDKMVLPLPTPRPAPVFAPEQVIQRIVRAFVSRFG